MTEPRDIIARGRELTGRKLLAAIEGARTQVVGGRGIAVNQVGSRAVVNIKGHPIIPRSGFSALITGGMLLADNRWDYDWSEAELDASNEWVIKPLGKRSSDPSRRPARNTTEHGNTATVVQHGIVLDQSLSVPGFILTLEPLPLQTLIELTESRIVTGELAYWFSKYGKLTAVCVIPALPPPVPDEQGVAI